MEHLKEDKARIFDDFYSNDNLTLLKILSFFMKDEQRPMIAILIKYMELNICMQKSIAKRQIPHTCDCHKKNPDFEDILCEIGDYLPKEGREMMEQLKDMRENMEMYSQMMEMMNMMNETSDNAGTNCENPCI